jgi:hypothetical protein
MIHLRKFGIHERSGGISFSDKTPLQVINQQIF